MPVTYVDIVDENDIGQRIDNYLLRVLKGVPRQHVYRVLRKGEVRVNGGRIRSSYRLQRNDRLRIPPVRTRQEMPVEYSQDALQTLQAATIYEDEAYLILDKPAGMAVHGGSSIRAGIVEIMRDALNLPRLELVHRLDRETSGCLALAKTRTALKTAQAAFRQRQVKKIYEVFVAGAWPERNRTVALKLKRYETAWGERRVRVSQAGQAARTDFAVLDRAPAATRLQASLHTGRTHQIRVHASASGHPILGDEKYGDGASGPRLCLHASRLSFPGLDGQIRVSAAVPGDLEAFWQALKTAAD